MVVTSSRSDTGGRRRRRTNSLHQLSPEFSFSRPVMETTPSQQGKSWAYSVIARVIWSTLNYSSTTLLGAQYIIAEQDSGPPTPSQCDQFCPSQLYQQMIESEPFGVFCIEFRSHSINRNKFRNHFRTTLGASSHSTTAALT